MKLVYISNISFLKLMFLMHLFCIFIGVNTFALNINKGSLNYDAVFNVLKSIPVDPITEVFTAKLTYYCPRDLIHKLEGGGTDSKGYRISTLQDYLSGRSKFVSVSIDLHACKYGTFFYSPELDQLYLNERASRPGPLESIPFVCVDTGSSFKNKKFSRIDVPVIDKNCNSNKGKKNEITQKLEQEYNGRLISITPFVETDSNLESE